MTGRLTGKIALISGASGDIGSATARLFADEGCKLALGDVRDAEGEQLADELGRKRAAFAHLDVRSSADWAGRWHLARVSSVPHGAHQQCRRHDGCGRGTGD